ncbi:MAG: hypothetical protein H8E57_07000 [Candidatus Cloacimonetes bacterium]|nr:hypothetical protein [Candidatus Cloacimonadota bacterium]
MIVRRKDFIKTKNADYVISIKTFRGKFPDYYAALGYSEVEKDDIIGEIDKCVNAFDDKTDKQNAAEAAVSKFINSKKELTAMLRLNAPRIKSAPPYTEEMGKILDIVGEEIIIDTDTMQPKLKIKILGDLTNLKWKKGYSEGVNIYSKRGDEADFTFLARDTASPYHDTRENLISGKSETREYYAFYIIDDVQVGLRSGIETITVP